jgi:hypothetical protein
MRHCRTARLSAGFALAVGCVLPAAPVAGQLTVAPELAYSRVRDLGFGIRIAHPLTRSGGIFAEVMEFFPNAEGTADPGVGVDSDYRQLHAGAYFVGRRASLQPYAGASVGWFTSSLTLERGGASATADRTEFFGQVLAGMRLPRDSVSPYVEARRLFDDSAPWVFAAGAAVALR